MIFPGFPGALPFFQVFQVEWEPWTSDILWMLQRMLGYCVFTAGHSAKRLSATPPPWQPAKNPPVSQAYYFLNFLAFLCRVDLFPIVFAHMCQEKIFLNHFRFQHAQYFFDCEDCPLSLGKRGSNFANATGHQRSYLHLNFLFCPFKKEPSEATPMSSLHLWLHVADKRYEKIRQHMCAYQNSWKYWYAKCLGISIFQRIKIISHCILHKFNMTRCKAQESPGIS